LPKPPSPAPFDSTTRPPQPVETAVILAAGLGSRLRATRPGQGDLAKPLTPLHGVSLLVRSLTTLAGLGVRHAVIVVGYAEEQIRTVAHDPRVPNLRITFAPNPDWKRQNGLSVLAAREAAGEGPFFLLMGDHLFEAALLRRLAQAPRPGDLLLAVDRRADDIYDLDDAVKVKMSEDGRILDLAKTLRDFNAVDTGAFVTGAALFDALERKRVEQGGDCSLSDGVAELARRGRAYTVDIGDAWWQDVDDDTAFGIALKKLENEEAPLAASKRG
jgi:choline kinase